MLPCALSWGLGLHTKQQIQQRHSILEDTDTVELYVRNYFKFTPITCAFLASSVECIYFSYRGFKLKGEKKNWLMEYYGEKGEKCMQATTSFSP